MQSKLRVTLARFTNRCLSYPERFSTTQLALLIFSVSLAVRLSLILGTKTYEFVEHSELVRVAATLATEGELGDAYGDGSGPTAHVSPLYPLVLSVIYRLFGVGTAASQLVQEVFASTLVSLQYAFLPLTAALARMRRTTGVLAGLAGALLPLNFWAQTKGSWEASLAAVFFVVAVTWTLRCWRRRRVGTRTAMLTGGLWGVGLLITPIAIPVMLGIFLAEPLVLRRGLVQHVRFAAVSIALTVVVATPWAVRNHHALGHLIWTRSNFGLELFLSNNEHASAAMRDNRARNRELHPFTSRTEREKLLAMGEVEYHRERKAEAVDWIVSHPVRFGELTAERIVRFWFPEMMRPVQELGLRVLALAGTGGLLLSLLRRNAHALPIAAMMLLFPAPYYLIQAYARYRYPWEWTVLIMGAFLVVDLAFRLSPSRRRAPDAERRDEAQRPVGA